MFPKILPYQIIFENTLIIENTLTIFENTWLI